MRPVWSVLTIAVALAVSGCSSDVAGPVSPKLIAGTWGETFSVPGGSFEMILAVAGTDDTGNAHGCGEAGPCSVSTITGTSDETGVHLTLVTTMIVPQPGAPFTENFDGKLVDANTLRGTLATEGTTESGAVPLVVTFHRE
jgi:hypothetical protein